MLTSIVQAKQAPQAKAIMQAPAFIICPSYGPVLQIRDIQQSLIQCSINGYTAMSLREMDGVALLNRTDTKFVMSSASLVLALQNLKDSYRVLDVGVCA